MIGIDAKTQQVESAIVRFAAGTKRSVAESLRYVMKSLTRDLIKLAPPFKSLSVNESFGEQRRIGEAAVKGDIERVFLPLESLRIYHSETRLGREIRRAIDSGRQDALEIIFQRSLKRGAISPALMDAVSQSNISAEINPKDHLSQRNRRGRVRRNPRRWAVSKRAVDRYVKSMQKRVGKLKAGFVAGAERFGVPVPAWIRRHSNTGRVIDEAAKTNDPSITLRNTVSYGPQQDSALRFVGIAMKNQLGKLERQIEARLKGLWK